MGNARAAKLEQVLSCAFRLFSESGFENVSIGDIAQSSGVDKATIIRNFRDKQRIYDAVAERFGNTLPDEAALDIAIPEDAGCDEGLFALLTNYHRILFGRVRQLRLYYMENAQAGNRRFAWPLLEQMCAHLKRHVVQKDVRALEDSLDSMCLFLVAFAAQSVWRSNCVDGHWLYSPELGDDFARRLQPQIDACLLTLLPE